MQGSIPAPEPLSWCHRPHRGAAGRQEAPHWWEGRGGQSRRKQRPRRAGCSLSGFLEQPAPPLAAAELRAPLSPSACIRAVQIARLRLKAAGGGAADAGPPGARTATAAPNRAQRPRGPPRSNGAGPRSAPRGAPPALPLPKTRARQGRVSRWRTAIGCRQHPGGRRAAAARRAPFTALPACTRRGSFIKKKKKHFIHKSRGSPALRSCCLGRAGPGQDSTGQARPGQRWSRRRSLRSGFRR